MAKMPGFTKAFAARWRMSRWTNSDSDFLDLVEKAHLTFNGRSDAEIAFGGMSVVSCWGCFGLD
ncbi:hypothetical protein ACVWXO_000956 [Bradyrhizobium sp. LM2.7]